MSLVFFWDRFLREMGLLLCSLTGPILSDASSHINCFPILWEPHLFYGLPLNVQDISKAIFVSGRLYVKFFWQFSLLPVDGRVENIKKRIS